MKRQTNSPVTYTKNTKPGTYVTYDTVTQRLPSRIPNAERTPPPITCGENLVKKPFSGSSSALVDRRQAFNCTALRWPDLATILISVETESSFHLNSRTVRLAVIRLHKVYWNFRTFFPMFCQSGLYLVSVWDRNSLSLPLISQKKFKIPSFGSRKECLIR